MKVHFTFVITILFTSLVFGQNQDYLITNKNDTLWVKILSLDGKKIEIIKEGDKKSSKKNFYDFIKMHIHDERVITNPTNLKVEKPEPGYAHIYIYRPYVYLGSAIGFKIKYNDQKLANIKTYSYLLHKVKAGETHKYERSGMNSKEIKIDAKDGEIYFVRVSYGSGAETFGGLVGGESIFIDNPDMAKYAILTMKMESPIWE